MKDPDLKGIFGQAWKAALTDEVKARWPTGLDTWLMHCPGAHPFWRHYVVSACALRDAPGVPPAKKRTPNSSHEVNVIALAPEFVATDDWCSDNEHRWAKHYLTPLNLSEQIEDFDDEKTNELVFLFIRAFCNGHSSPDDDFRTYNRRLFASTIDHLRRGLHEVH